MSANKENRPAHAGIGAARVYPSELRLSLQSLLATLANLDFEHESDVETIGDSSANEWLKQTVIRKLLERHQQRRAPFFQQLERLQRQLQALAA
jgi:hypothetical protein